MGGVIYLEDGTLYRGEGFGASGTAVGEVVFNTTMVGYQHVLEDTSSSGLILNMTYPSMGSYGVKDEGRKSFVKGMIAKMVVDEPSNYECNKSLDDYLKERNIVGVKGVDTRAITKKIRKDGVMKCVISNEDISEDELKERIKDSLKHDYILDFSIKEIERIKGKELNIGILDLGQKDDVLKVLKNRDLGYTIFPYNVTKDEVSKEKIDGLIITNGPGMAEKKETIDGIVELVKSLITEYPTFGVSLGHQIIALACGAKVKKMKYGHRGWNHGVYDYEKKRAFIVPQNHGYVVDEDSLAGLDFEVSHLNLNDSTIEGLKHTKLNVRTIQFELQEEDEIDNTSYILNSFVDSLKEEK